MTPTESQSLDLDRLEKVRHLPGKITARCPACAEEDHDRTGNHLVVFDDGRFTCIADEGHRRRIWELVGIRRDLNPVEDARRREEWIRRKREETEQERKRQAAQKALPALVKRWAWDPADVAKDSPMDPEEGDCPRGFLLTMFRPQALVWTGQVHDSGERHADRWKTVWQCLHEPAENIGPMVTPSTWKPGTVSRTRENVAAAPYVILDFDGPKGWKPHNQADLDRHIAESLAIVRWLKEDRQWNLAAIVYTGNKSLHAWFDHPGESLLSSLRESLPILGIDKSLIGHPEHPARLPGKVHDKSGKMSRVLWLRYNGKR
jgi:hypothetical protein